MPIIRQLRTCRSSSLQSARENKSHILMCGDAACADEKIIISVSPWTRCTVKDAEVFFVGNAVTLCGPLVGQSPALIDHHSAECGTTFWDLSARELTSRENHASRGYHDFCIEIFNRLIIMTVIRYLLNQITWKVHMLTTTFSRPNNPSNNRKICWI